MPAKLKDESIPVHMPAEVKAHIAVLAERAGMRLSPFCFHHMFKSFLAENPLNDESLAEKPENYKKINKSLRSVGA
ncbi:MAG: hypothetical protein V7731_24165 [Amphritea sp.]